MSATTGERTAPTRPAAPAGPDGGRRGAPPGDAAPPDPAPAAPRRPVDRARLARRAGAAAVTLVMLAYPFLLTDPRSPLAHGHDRAVVRLYTDGLAAGPAGDPPDVVTAGTTAAYLPGSRVLDPGPDAGAATAGAERLAAASRAWLAAGTVPGAGGPYEDMAQGALLDLRTLLLDDGAAVAAWSPRWRYVWPRDASFVAVALARTGHAADALAVLGFLQRVQHPAPRQ